MEKSNGGDTYGNRVAIPSKQTLGGLVKGWRDAAAAARGLALPGVKGACQVLEKCADDLFAAMLMAAADEVARDDTLAEMAEKIEDLKVEVSAADAVRVEAQNEAEGLAESLEASRELCANRGKRIAELEAHVLELENELELENDTAPGGEVRRVDTAGRDVTDLPGLWSEDDRAELGPAAVVDHSELDAHQAEANQAAAAGRSGESGGVDLPPGCSASRARKIGFEAGVRWCARQLRGWDTGPGGGMTVSPPFAADFLEAEFAAWSDPPAVVVSAEKAAAAGARALARDDAAAARAARVCRANLAGQPVDILPASDGDGEVVQLQPVEPLGVAVGDSVPADDERGGHLVDVAVGSTAWDEIQRACGFHDYALDFSGVPAELVEKIGGVMAEHAGLQLPPLQPATDPVRAAFGPPPSHSPLDPPSDPDFAPGAWDALALGRDALGRKLGRKATAAERSGDSFRGLACTACGSDDIQTDPGAGLATCCTCSLTGPVAWFDPGLEVDRECGQFLAVDVSLCDGCGAAIDAGGAGFYGLAVGHALHRCKCGRLNARPARLDHPAKPN